jgi:hypothetical protein
MDGKLEREHRALRVTVDRLSAVAHCPLDVLPAARWHSLLRSELRHFRRTLEHHFEREEASDYFNDLAGAFPRLGRQIDQLRQDHAQMRANLSELAYGVERQSDLDGARVRLRDLLHMLDEHERRESALFQDAFLTDEGGPG